MHDFNRKKNTHKPTQGSNDGQNWTIIKRHVEDPALNAKGATNTWKLSGAVEPYRMFRILQWGINSNKHNYLSLSGIEFYGTLYHNQPGNLIVCCFNN